MNSKKKTRWYHYLMLAGVLAVALFFRVYNIEEVGFGNLYYATTVYSMLTSPVNFFFGSFDPAGFVTVDKPPLGFWIQSISALIFGFQGWALLLPQIVAGVLACLVLFWLVKRFHGPNAGILAALILAVTPIAIATDRNNTMDAQLLLVLLLSAVTLIKAVEKGSLSWLVLGAVLIGLGFNIKMLQAYMVLPAFYGLYFIAANTSWFRRFLHLGVFSIVLVIVSFAWPVTVDIIPAEYRPYIGSSQNNSVIELITGHNGVKRLGLIAGLIGLTPEGGAGLPNDQRPIDQLSPPPAGNLSRVNKPPKPLDNPGAIGPQNLRPPLPANSGRQNVAGNQGTRPGGDETGEVGIFRLYNEQLVGQTSWLLPLALLMIPILVFRKKITWPIDQEIQFVLFWGLWLIPMVIFFSFAGLFHRYYLEMLAPAIGALVAAGIVGLSKDLFENRKIGWLLPLAILGCVVFEAGVVYKYWSDWAGWAAVFALVLGFISFFGLVLSKVLFSNSRNGINLFATFGIGAILVVPILWSTTLFSAGDVGLPHAGPDLIQIEQKIEKPQTQLASFSPINRSGNSMASSAALVEFLEKNLENETFIVAGMRANDVAPIILQTGRAAMAIGGFSGSDPIVTLDEFKDYIENGLLRYVLLGGNQGPNGNNKQEISNWVTNTCVAVNESEWSTSPPSSDRTGMIGARENQILYDCR